MKVACIYVGIRVLHQGFHLGPGVGSQGFLLSTTIMTPGYIDRKQREYKTQRTFIVLYFPTY